MSLKKYHDAFWDKLLFNSGKLQMWVWRFVYNFAFRGRSNEEIVVLNYGYALLSDAGIYLDKYKEEKWVF